ncbi:PD-(D/E)XK nuclease domain-containing protein [Desulfothermus naphthae]
MSFNDAFLSYLTPSPPLKDQTEVGLIKIFQQNRIEDLKDILHSFFAGISYEFYRKNELDKYEGYYASIVYALFNGAGLDVSSQVTSNKGRVDLTVKYKDRVYLIEFKVVDKDSEGKALEQIKEKNIMNNL